MKLYRVVDWERHYEVSDSKKVDGPLSWVALRTKQDGFGFRRIAAERNSCELFAAWVLMVEIAARQNKRDRGKLIRDGRPLNAKTLAIMTGFPEPAFEKALDFFCDPEQGWIETVALPDTPASPAVSVSPDVAPGVTAHPATTTPNIRINPDASGTSGLTGQDRTGQDRKTDGQISLPQLAKGRSPTKDDDATWLASLAANEAYRGIDVPREYAKMKVWCLSAHKQPTRRRFVNWLNRCERPLVADKIPSGQTQRITVPKRYSAEDARER